MEARLLGETDLAGFREEARNLLARQVPPESVQWQLEPPAESARFETPDTPQASRPRNMPKAATALVPASFLRLCESVALHRDPDRFALLYRLLWRLVHEPNLRNDALDADMQHAQHMAHAVRRDLHKMKSNLRFQPVAEPGAASALQLAWYEATHHIIEAASPWFARQMGGARWAILSPERSVSSDGSRLLYGPGVEPAHRIGPDADAQDWLAAYWSVFGRPQGA
jgi:probable DNA metabolism protein